MFTTYKIISKYFVVNKNSRIFVITKTDNNIKK